MIFNIYKKSKKPKKEPDAEIQITYNPTYTTSSNQGSSYYYGFFFFCSSTDNRDDEIDDLDELLDEFDCNPDFDI